MNSFTKTPAFFFLLLLPVIWGCQKNEPDPIQKTRIEIGAVLSLTGNWSTLGITSTAAIEIAVNEVNESFAVSGVPFELALSVYDSKLEPSLAASFFNQAIESGGKFILGPQSSGELATIKPLADAAASALIISHGSTAGNLAIANDAIFRFCPADKLEGDAIAKTMKQQGIQAVIAMARNDDGNKGLQSATTEAFVRIGGHATYSIAPYGETQTDFSEQLDMLKTQIAHYAGNYGAAGVGVYLASFDECVELFKQASGDPLLSSVRWYGSDGVAHSTALINDPEAASFAEKTSYFAPSFGLPAEKEPVWKPLSDKIKADTGMDADAFTLAAYDAVQVIGETIKSLGNVNQATLDILKGEFRRQADSFSGATGSTTLNEYGDRLNGSFDYWGIRKSGNTYEWVLTGRSE